MAGDYTSRAAHSPPRCSHQHSAAPPHVRSTPREPAQTGHQGQTSRGERAKAVIIASGTFLHFKVEPLRLTETTTTYNHHYHLHIYNAVTARARLPALRMQVAFAHGVPKVQDPKDFSTPVHINPISKNDYQAFTDFWVKYFQTAKDEIDLERGLNNCFEFDWCPDVAVLEEALKATRRLNSFATAVRTLEAVDFKTTAAQYTEVIAHLKPLITELGIPEVKELGEFNASRLHNKWID